MKHSPARILAQLITGVDYKGVRLANLASNPSWPIFWGKMPDAPDNLIVMRNTTPVADGRDMRSKSKLFHHGVQARVRGTTEEVSFERCSLIGEYFDTIQRNTITFDSKTYRVDNISRTSDPIALGQEEGRSRYSTTLNVLLTLVDVTTP